MLKTPMLKALFQKCYAVTLLEWEFMAWTFFGKLLLKIPLSNRLGSIFICPVSPITIDSAGLHKNKFQSLIVEILQLLWEY